MASSLQGSLRSVFAEARKWSNANSTLATVAAATFGIAVLAGGLRMRARAALPAAPPSVCFTRHAPNVWTFESSNLLRWPVIGCFPVRMTVLKLTDESLLIYSPIDLDVIRRALPGTLEEELGGPIRYIVCPNLQHHLWAPAWKQEFPAAKIYVAPGLPAKVPSLPYDHEFNTGPLPPVGFPEEVKATFVGGMPMLNEVVLFHEPTSTLLVCDTALNFDRSQVRSLSWPLRVYLGVIGGALPLCVPRTFRFFVKDKASVNAAFQQIMSYSFERVVPCHGDVVHNDAHRALADGSARFFASL